MQVQKDKLVRAAAAIFEAAGSTTEEASKVASRLVDANLTGHDSHGVIRIPQYVEHVANGTLKPNQRAEVVADLGAVTVLDGHFGYGQIVGEQAIDAAIAKARTEGIGMTTLRNAGHLGRIGDWAARATDVGMVSMNFVNAIGHQLIVVPHGGVEARGSTNPIAIGVPIEGEEPVILDFATSAVAEGKVRVARNKGTFLPPDCLLDAEGCRDHQPLGSLRRSRRCSLAVRRSGHRPQGGRALDDGGSARRRSLGRWLQSVAGRPAKALQ